jgi:CheY-like chemotaxis protein
MQKVLLADSSVTIQKVVDLVLSDKGYKVKAVASGGEAMAVLSSFTPDIVLVDINLPEMNGYELAEKIHVEASTRDIPVILLAGAFEPIDESRASKAGVNGSLLKPFEANELLGKLDSVLHGSPEAAEEAVEVVEASFAGEAEPDLTALDEEPVEVEVLDEVSAAEEVVEVAITEEEVEEALAQAPAAGAVHAPEIPVPDKDDLMAVFKDIVDTRIEGALTGVGQAVRDAVDSKLETALRSIDQAVRDAVDSKLESALGGVDQAVRDAVDSKLEGALGRADQAVRDAVDSKLESALGGVGQAVGDSIGEKLEGALGDVEKAAGNAVGEKIAQAVNGPELMEALVKNMSQDMKAVVEKILWEAAPYLTENLIKKDLKESIGSLRQEIEKVLWETLPELAESVIKEEIDKIRAKS